MANMWGRYGLSARTDSFPWIDADPLDRGRRPTVYLAMLETADGCIRFLQENGAPEVMRFQITRPIAVSLKSDPSPLSTLTRTRTYDLVDRSGPNGEFLHYKERVD